MCLGFLIRKNKKKPHYSETPVPLSGLSRAEDRSQKAEEGAQPTDSDLISYQPAVTETATPQAKQETQIPAIPKSLPSQVDDTLGACPR